MGHLATLSGSSVRSLDPFLFISTSHLILRCAADSASRGELHDLRMLQIDLHDLILTNGEICAGVRIS
jgi:hypothetical protein